MNASRRVARLIGTNPDLGTVSAASHGASASIGLVAADEGIERRVEEGVLEWPDVAG